MQITNYISGGVPEWPKGTDCKSAAFRFDGSNPSSPTTKSPTPFGVGLFVVFEADSNPSKCNCPVDSCLMRARPHQHLTLFPKGTTAIESVLPCSVFLHIYDSVFCGGGGHRIRKAALSGSPVDCCKRRSFAAVKRIRPHVSVTGSAPKGHPRGVSLRTPTYTRIFK